MMLLGRIGKYVLATPQDRPGSWRWACQHAAAVRLEWIRDTALSATLRFVRTTQAHGGALNLPAATGNLWSSNPERDGVLP